MKTINLLKNIYVEIDNNCIEETDTVKMSEVKRILTKHGARLENE